MIKSFNLLDEPWIPCLTKQRRQVILSLPDVLTQANELREVYSESPLITASLYRLLLTVLYAAYQPYKRRDWLEIRQQGIFADAGNYLMEWHDHFYLHHPTHPFFQTTEEIGKPQTLAGLYVELARGNNATLFDHSRDEEMLVLDAATAARALLAGQYFPLGGGISGIKGKNFTDATLTRGVSFLAQGETLFETLLFNLVPFEHLPNAFNKRERNADENKDRPIWERETPFARDRSVPDGIADYLTWPSRRIKLMPDDKGQIIEMYRSQGQTVDSIVTRDPYKLFYTSKSKGILTPLLFQQDKALWRDSETLFRIHKTGVEPPVPFTWLDKLHKNGVIEQGASLRCMALGMSTEPGRATIYFTRYELLPLPVAILDDDPDNELLRLLTEALSVAQKVSYGLRDAAKATGIYLYVSNDKLQDESGNWKPLRKDKEGNWVLLRKDKGGKWVLFRKVEINKTTSEDIAKFVESLQIMTVFWERLGGYFTDYLHGLADAEQYEIVQKTWSLRVRSSAEFAFRTVAQTLPDQTLRSRHATIVGRDWLRRKLNQHVPLEKDDDNK